MEWHGLDARAPKLATSSPVEMNKQDNDGGGGGGPTIDYGKTQDGGSHGGIDGSALSDSIATLTVRAGWSLSPAGQTQVIATVLVYESVLVNSPQLPSTIVSCFLTSAFSTH